MRVNIARLRATVTAVVVFGYVGIVSPFFIVLSWVTGDVMWVYRCAQAGCRIGMWLGGVTVELQGEENYPRGDRVIFMCNHLSNIEPPVLFAVLPPQIAFMAKRQLFKIPILRTAMRMGDFVSVPREDPEKAKASVEEALKKLKKVSFLVFPEGTRSRDGSLQKFRHGVFHLAIRGQVPIVPLTVTGADEIMRKGIWQLYPGTMRLQVHPRVETAGMSIEDRFELADRVRRIIGSTLPAHRRGV